MKETEGFDGKCTSVFSIYHLSLLKMYSNVKYKITLLSASCTVIQWFIDTKWNLETQTLIINALVSCEVHRTWAEAVKASAFPYTLRVVALEGYTTSDWQCLCHWISALLRIKIWKVGFCRSMFFSNDLRKYSHNTVNYICINFTFQEHWHIEEVLEIL